MTQRENLLSLYRRQGYETAPVYMVLCPHLEDEFHKRYGDKITLAEHFEFPVHTVTDPGFPWIAEIKGFVPQREFDWNKYYNPAIKQGARMDMWGIAHEPGGPEVKHMTHMRHPLQYLENIKDVENYPWPDFYKSDFSVFEQEIKDAQAKGLAAHVWMECTIWETAWYLRGMETLFVDMYLESEIARFLFDKITELACYRAEKFAQMGTDILALGDDIGMQSTILMDKELYRTWLKPGLKKVIDSARKYKPDIIIQYHSCGYVQPLIGDLIEAGIDVLNPVQPECMNYEEIYRKFGDALSFNGTLGTQSTMPFGTTEDVRKTVEKNLRLSGKNGGLFCCPTHMLEPEVPWENVEAYVEACKNFKL